MSSIFDKIKNNEIIAHLEKKDGRFVVHDSLSLALTVGALYTKKPQRLCVVASNLYAAQQVYEALVTMLGEEHVLFFPQDEVLRLDVEAYSKEMLAQRLYVLEKCLEEKNAVLVCHVASLTRFLPEKELFERNSLHFEVGKSYSLEETIRKLISLSFTRVNKIDQSLQFALRGDILDIYPINEENPIRIEFFDDEVESIRFFSLNDQLSLKSVDKIDIYPASDLLLDEESLKGVEPALEKELIKCKDKIPYDAYLNLEKRVRNDIEEIKEEGLGEKFYKYYSFIYKQKCNVLDYFNPDLTIVYDKEKCDSSYEFLISQSYLYYVELCKAGLALSSYNLFDDYLASLEHSKRNIFTHSTYENDKDIELGIRAISNVAPNIMKSIQIINKYLEEGKKVVVCLDNSQYETYKLYLDDANVKYEEINFNEVPSSLAICHYKLNDGFELINEKIIYLSAKEIFGYKPSISKFLHRYKQAKVIKSYEELEIGDYVVHEESGIGRFEGIVTLKTLDVHKDFLKIHYAGSDVLYVPLEQFKLVRKFVSKEGAVPKINKLNGTDWARTKNRIKDKINNLAERLLLLYAQRNAELGFAFKEDDEFQKAFEKAFPFPLTEDQEKAVEEIKKDMMSPHPMDRLLCGDVGFGKTEVAFRAAFKAILSGAQVALLCPTTLLARQHYERALERFSLFGVRIAMFSRFVPLSEQKRMMQDIKEGKVHLIIGTHRLLSKEIVIPNLKLLIVDEEQRFGVEHKERIKEVARGIDVLTLSATPIPRTLQMSLLGIRSLSLLSSAPSNRMPIQTYVAPYQDNLVKEAIERELARGGQVFYLHNNTSTIVSKANKIAKMINGARISVVHGQMDKEDIEDTMTRFYNNEINILVCTSIIETGLDIANANTMIIEEADHFGLSQLYQIKGRVGRSDRIAYAYLLYNKDKELSDISKKRLKAIKDFTELGSGYKIAQRDLTIRGAGDILGPEQAGFIDTVGVDMYIKLLNEVLQEKQGTIAKEKVVKVNNLSIDAYIPSSYATDGDKLELYQEIQTLNTIPQLEIFASKLKDVYGKLPPQVELLIRKRRIDILGNSANIEAIKEESGAIVVLLTQEISSINRIGIILFEKLGEVAKHVVASFEDRKIKLRLKKSSLYVDELEKLLSTIGSLKG